MDVSIDGWVAKRAIEEARQEAQRKTREAKQAKEEAEYELYARERDRELSERMSLRRRLRKMLSEFCTGKQKSSKQLFLVLTQDATTAAKVISETISPLRFITGQARKSFGSLMVELASKGYSLEDFFGHGDNDIDSIRVQNFHTETECADRLADQLGVILQKLNDFPDDWNDLKPGVGEIASRLFVTGIEREICPHLE